MRMCFMCSEPISEGVAIRMREMQVVEILEEGEVEFDHTEFLDGSRIKWLCNRCKVEHGLYPGHLALDHCVLCGSQFFSDESALYVEYGALHRSERIQATMLDTQFHGYVHYLCACDDWNLHQLYQMHTEP